MPIKKKTRKKIAVEPQKVTKSSLVIERTDYEAAKEGIQLAKVIEMELKLKQLINYKGEEKIKDILEVKLELLESGKIIKDRMIWQLSEGSKLGKAVKAVVGEVPKKIDIGEVLQNAIVGVEIQNNEKNGIIYNNVKEYIPADEVEEYEDDLEDIEEEISQQDEIEEVVEDEEEYEEEHEDTVHTLRKKKTERRDGGILGKRVKKTSPRIVEDDEELEEDEYEDDEE